MNAASLCGATHWRLPTRRELLTIVNAGRSSPSIDSVFFQNTALTNHWTASTYTADSTVALTVGFYTGDTHAFIKTDSFYGVRLVRSGQCFSAFVANGTQVFIMARFDRLPKPDKPEKLQLDCGSGFTAMRVSDSSQSRWNRSHKDDPVF